MCWILAARHDQSTSLWLVGETFFRQKRVEIRKKASKMPFFKQLKRTLHVSWVGWAVSHLQLESEACPRANCRPLELGKFFCSIRSLYLGLVRVSLGFLSRRVISWCESHVVREVDLQSRRIALRNFSFPSAIEELSSSLTFVFKSFSWHSEVIMNPIPFASWKKRNFQFSWVH